MFSNRNGRALFGVIGNIGSGKTTLTENLADLFEERCILLREPVQLWIDSGFLSSFYQNMKKYAFSFQMFAFATRARQYKEVIWSDCRFAIADGHVISDKNVFAQKLKLGGDITEDELKWYNITYESWEHIIPEMDATMWVYLRASPETCLKRIRERKRTEESTITLEYLTSLHALFESLQKNPKYKGKILVIDAEDDEQTITKKLAELFNTITSGAVEVL